MDGLDYTSVTFWVDLFYIPKVNLLIEINRAHLSCLLLNAPFRLLSAKRKAK